MLSRNKPIVDPILKQLSREFSYLLQTLFLTSSVHSTECSKKKCMYSESKCAHYRAMRRTVIATHAGHEPTTQLLVQRLMHMSTLWRTLLRSTDSSHSIYNNAWILKRHTLHTSSVSRLRAFPCQKFHATDFFSAYRDALRRAPRRHWQPVGPFQRFRRRFDNIPSDYLLFGILGINGAVFAAWSYVQMYQVRPPSPLRRRSSRGAGYVIQATQRQVARQMAAR